MLNTSAMRTVILIALIAVAIVTAGATLFFAYFGVQLVYHALTADGEDPVGHIYVQVGAILYPLLGLVSGRIAFVSWRAFRRRVRRGEGR